MPAKELNLSKGEQFLAGLAIGVGIFIVVRAGPKVIVGAASKLAPKLLTKELAKHVVHDQLLGRVPVVDPSKPITKGIIITSIANTLFWIFGGVDTIKDAARISMGKDTVPGGNRLGFDEIIVEDDGRTWNVTSRSGSIQYVTINGARVDP